MRDELSVNGEGFSAKGLLRALQKFSPEMLLIFGVATVLVILILRCRSSSKQSINGSTINDAKVIQDASSAFWQNSEQSIDNSKINASNVVQRNLKK